jgi:hypothetical protein|tara:strand:+ start:559 stop:942 length:384 start_codon:yes stop_codon:yes gene_type:complete
MKNLLLFAFTALILSSCSMYTASMSESLPEVRLDLNDLDISKVMQASATVKVYFGIFVTGGNKYSASSSTYGSKTKTSSQAAAAYRLIQSNSDYDFIMYPKYETKSTGGLFIKSETTTVTAKLGKLK